MTDTVQPSVASAQPRMFSAAQLEVARGRLADRGIDPHQRLGESELGDAITVTGLYLQLGAIAATEKAGQDPTFALARIALQAGLGSEVADSLFLAYNQQSAEEAGHGDKVFGNAYFAMGGAAVTGDLSAVGNPANNDNDDRAGFLLPTDDPKRNKHLLTSVAGVLGGIETAALHRIFPLLGTLCEAWGHPIARDLLAQLRDTVRPEESRHVLLWRYVFHKLMAPKGDKLIDIYFQTTNMGRRQIAAPELDKEASCACSVPHPAPSSCSAKSVGKSPETSQALRVVHIFSK